MVDLTNGTRCDVLIVGAGIAGLVAARALHGQDIPVLVVDKEERVGGRIVTEHIGGGWADTGAQFFTARDPLFQKTVDQWLAEQLIFEWTTGWVQGSSGDVTDDGHPRYAAYEGLNAVCRRLAQDIPIHKSIQIESILTDGEQWTAVDDSGDTYTSSALILTPPVPITLSLLEDITLSQEDLTILQGITYAPTISGVVHIEGQALIPKPGAIQNPGERIHWLADNQLKGISPAAKTLTVHLKPEISQLWWLSPDEELKGAIQREIRPFLEPKATIIDVHIHRWPHALPTNLHTERTLVARDLPPLAFAGDAFDGPRVEGAALSGLAAAAEISKLIC